jgi:hypothetical protein
MRCKPGDLAVIVKGDAGDNHVGKLVTTVRLFDADSWVCNPRLLGFDGRGIAWLDSALRPIRPSDGEDESLSWKEVPKVLDKPEEHV